MTAASAKIAFSICTYDRYDLLPKALESAVRQSLPSSQYRILVIDNSPDHERARAFKNRVGTIPNLAYVVEETPGLSNARNRAAQICETEFIAFMDDDAIASPTWLAEILDAFASFGPKAMVVGGRVNPIWGTARPPWLHDSMLGNLSVVDWGGQTRIAASDEWFAGTNIAFRTSSIRDHGGFATNLGRNGSTASLLSNEELHLLERIGAGGGLLIYAPSADVDHLAEPKRLTRDWFRKRAAWQAVSDFTMDSKRFANESRNYWKQTVAYFNALPPHERTIRGLIYETDDPNLFVWQTGAIYMQTIMMLAGFEGVALDQPSR